MMYEIKLHVTEEELRHNKFALYDIRQLYKPKCDEAEKNWILEHANMIEGIAANYIYDLYYNDFKDKEIVTKHKLYQMCRELLNLDTKMARIEDNTMYCFTKKFKSR